MPGGQRDILMLRPRSVGKLAGVVLSADVTVGVIATVECGVSLAVL
jgi:hypothetical protein